MVYPSRLSRRGSRVMRFPLVAAILTAASIWLLSYLSYLANSPTLGLVGLDFATNLMACQCGSAIWRIDHRRRHRLTRVFIIRAMVDTTSRQPSTSLRHQPQPSSVVHAHASQPDRLACSYLGEPHRSQSGGDVTDRGPDQPRLAKCCQQRALLHPSRSKRASNHFKRFAFSTTGDTQSMAFRTDTRHTVLSPTRLL